MTEKTSGGSKGLLDSLAALAATLVSMAHTRLALLSSDLEEDRERMLSLLVLTLVGLFFLGVGLVLGIILLVILFWDTQRLLVLGVLAGLFLLSGIAVWLFAVYRFKTKPCMFSASLTELSEDWRQLSSRD